MIYLPKELPELRDKLADWAEGPDGWKLMQPHLLKDGMDPLSIKPVSEAVALLNAHAMRDGLLLHVNQSMVDLLMQARHGVGEAGFMDYDLPSSTGVAYFATELDNERKGYSEEHWAQLCTLLEEQGEDPVAWRARHEPLDKLAYQEHLLCVWKVLPPQPEYPMGYVQLSWWFERDAWLAAWDQRSKALGKERVTSWSDASLPRFVPDGHQFIGFHPESANVQVMFAGGETFEKARRPDMFRALCYLLRQRIAEESTVMPDRAARRRYARQGKEPPPVRVISIRGGSAHGGGDGSREYVHRWVVRGHWRRQWYRSIQAHRPVWITPYVKGPEDAPLLGGEKVYSLSP